MGNCKVGGMDKAMRINPIREYFYLPEDYDPQKEYPVLVQFYETHSGGLNTYHAPDVEQRNG